MVDKMDETLSSCHRDRMKKSVSHRKKRTTMPSDTDLFLFKESQVSLGKQIGEGGYGVVYVGTYNGTDTVAVKKLHVARLSNQLKAVFEKELAVWRSLPAHENIMPLLGYCYEPPMLLAQLADGGNLNDYLDAKNWDQALGITCLYGVAVGMNFLHGKNVFHGDLKSYNVLVHRGIPKIADFGLAQLRARTTAVTTKAGQGVGTVRWMAPELFETGLQKPADVYAYAMTCYEVLSEGGFPFMDVGSNDAVKHRVLNGQRPDRPSNVPDKLWKLVQDCWKQDPNQRPDFATVVKSFPRELGAELRSAGSTYDKRANIEMQTPGSGTRETPGQQAASDAEYRTCPDCGGKGKYSTGCESFVCFVNDACSYNCVGASLLTLLSPVAAPIWCVAGLCSSEMRGCVRCKGSGKVTVDD